jgi:hypothetical protein
MMGHWPFSSFTGHGETSRRHTKALLLMLFVASLAASLAVANVSFGGQGSPLASCADFTSCMWAGEDYTGQNASVDSSACCDWTTVVLGQGVHSAKNRFTNRFFKVRGDFTHCLNPNDNRHAFTDDTGVIDQFRVGPADSRCS